MRHLPLFASLVLCTVTFGVGCSASDEPLASSDEEVNESDDSLCLDFPDARELGIDCAPPTIEGRSIATNIRKVAPTLHARLKGWKFYPYGTENPITAVPDDDMSIRLSRAVLVRPSIGDPNLAIWHRAGSARKVFATAGLTYLRSREVEFHVAARISKLDFDLMVSTSPRPLEELGFGGVNARESIEGVVAAAVKETTRHFPEFQAPTPTSDKSGEPLFTGAKINEDHYYLTSFYTLDPSNSYLSFTYFLQALQDESKDESM
jgi:hypothetical protein